MREILKEFWLYQGRKLSLQLLSSGFFIIIVGKFLGYDEIIMGVVEGYILGAIYIYIMIFRINRLNPQALKRGKVEMWFGLILRLLALLVISKLAFAQNVIMGYMILGAFGWMFLLFMGNLIYYNYKYVQ